MPDDIGAYVPPIIGSYWVSTADGHLGRVSRVIHGDVRIGGETSVIVECTVGCFDQGFSVPNFYKHNTPPVDTSAEALSAPLEQETE